MPSAGHADQVKTYQEIEGNRFKRSTYLIRTVNCSCSIKMILIIIIMIKIIITCRGRSRTPTTTNTKLHLTLYGSRKPWVISQRAPQLHKYLKDYVKVMIPHQRAKLSSRFQIKDQTKFEHRNRNDAAYRCKCTEKVFDDFYIGETYTPISKRIIDHNKSDKNSHPLQHEKNTKHAHVWIKVLTILNSNYRSNIKSKISESLHVRSQ